MAHILAYTSPARGHLFPLTPILLELQRRGHKISLRTLSTEVEKMQKLGFETSAIDSRIEEISHQDWKASNPRAALSASVSTFVKRSEIEVPDLRRAIEEIKPDFLIIDTNCWGAQAVAEAWGGSWASFCPFPVPLSSKDAPPFGLGLKPAQGALGRLRDKFLRPLIMGMLEKTTLTPYNEIRNSLGLTSLKSADDLYLSPPLLLLLTAEPFEYPRTDWPANVALVGPCDWDPEGISPEWLTEIDKPIVLVSTSSEYQADEILVKTALDALKDEDLFVVVTAPSLDISDIEVPKNARIEKFISHAAILSRASCAITHGGMGVTQKALSHGVPVCAVPFGRDQFEVARRVELSGAGSRLPAKRLSPSRLRTKVLEAMNHASGARQVAEKFRLAGEAIAASNAIEQTIRTGTKHPADLT
jgi:MGT family glycosyltransferase